MRADVERLPARFRMGADQRVHGIHILLRRRHALAHRIAAVVVALGARLAAIFAVAHAVGLHVGQHLLHAVRERIVGEIQVGEHGVAARGRRLLRVEHGRLRGLLAKLLVGVPAVAEVLRLGLGLDDLEDLGIRLHPPHVGMQVYVAPALGEAEILGRRHRLVAEEDDVVLEPGAVDFREGRVVQLRQVHTADLGPHRAAHARDGDPFVLCRLGGVPQQLRHLDLTPQKGASSPLMVMRCMTRRFPV